MTHIQFKVVPAYDGMMKYVDAARAENADLGALHQRYVLDPYWDECVAGGEYEGLGRTSLGTPIRDLDGLANEINVLRASGVEAVVEKALRHISTLLPGPDTTVGIFAVNPQNEKIRDRMHGIGGFTAGAGKIVAQINPVGDWLSFLPYMLAHEHHHSVWTFRHSKEQDGFDLADYLVFEGRADSFARIAYPQFVAPWNQALTPQQEQEQWQAMQGYLDNADMTVMRRFIFGDEEVPMWAGYTIGFKLVQTFLKKHPGLSVDEWTAMDAHDILTESGYAGIS